LSSTSSTSAVKLPQQLKPSAAWGWRV
jgi:hypothetical protein